MDKELFNLPSLVLKAKHLSGSSCLLRYLLVGKSLSRHWAKLPQVLGLLYKINFHVKDALISYFSLPVIASQVRMLQRTQNGPKSSNAALSVNGRGTVATSALQGPRETRDSQED